MKTIYIILASLFISLQSASAQIFQYKDSLDIIVLDRTNKYEESIYQQEINVILMSDDYNIRREIKDARRNSTLNSFTLERLNYLRNLRRAANYNDNALDFRNRVLSDTPHLEQSLINNIKLYLIYDKIRKDTFHGRLNALPSIL
ncbi:hypothetical protein BST97_14095 [Nonlabens spongiae]|uniref:Uncharacterized protein n=1 Tax=Nonlabens spongiae TaxID=331648 RepID=A0A1W6MN59_9FLAO|nr:hypothetical protein [Nonlabens spongiae]ARN79028.1 hypothetical protein BST97_14095 [Nonlabens spongiae]